MLMVGPSPSEECLDNACGDDAEVTDAIWPSDGPYVTACLHAVLVTYLPPAIRISNATGSSVTEYTNIFVFRNRQKDAWSDDIESSSKRLKRSEVLQTEFAAYSTVRLIKTRYSSFKVCVSPILEVQNRLTCCHPFLRGCMTWHRVLVASLFSSLQKDRRRWLPPFASTQQYSNLFFFFLLSGQVYPPRFQVPARSLFHPHVSCHSPYSGYSLGLAASQSCCQGCWGPSQWDGSQPPRREGLQPVTISASTSENRKGKQ